MGKLALGLFLSIFYLVGFGVLWYSINSAQKSIQASQWPSTMGTLEKVSLHENLDDDSSTYEVRVEYRYSVMGQTYTSSRLAFGYTGSSGRKQHQEILKKLQNASVINVRYNPNNPATSVLSFGIHRSIKFLFAFAITWLSFVVGITLIIWIDSQSDRTLLDNIDIIIQ
ncbi:DUF3592 domain-containing protein [Roseofilum casamattae]|uniref:DUF3592 domain-containing protein n=1 Tax=Roseofilum casamattae BLCC-M143 TaxID=3022442 RepID=A0ABT7BU88_9CYAN|nr:DUF3592 domain-containing protein [Roseofilum casamattae]MDJ1182757.1 DUF3592 domain-containing protein [Roseofilum casamattae BLCC-M143]